MKKHLESFNRSLSMTNLSILGYLNFIVSNMLLWGSDGISAILFNKLPASSAFSLTEYNAGYSFGFFIYFIELIVISIIYKFESKKQKLSTSSQSSTRLKNILLYMGLLLFWIEFLFATILQIMYIIRFARF